MSEMTSWRRLGQYNLQRFCLAPCEKPSARTTGDHGRNEGRHAELLRHIDPGFLADLAKKKDIILDHELLGEGCVGSAHRQWQMSWIFLSCCCMLAIWDEGTGKSIVPEAIWFA